MSKAWIERQTASEESRREYEQERLVLWTTDQLCEAMDERGTSKAELAAMLGTSRANVTNLLSGARNMTLRTVADVACVLGHRVELSLEPLRQGEFITTPVRTVHSLRRRAVVSAPVSRTDYSAEDMAGDGGETLAA